LTTTPFFLAYMTDDIHDLKVLVTGASSGIGLAICRQLLEAGARVLGVARDPAKMPLSHEKLSFHSMDLADLDQLPTKLNALYKQHSDVNALICCAGMGRFGSLEEFSFDQIRSLLDLNLVGQIYVIRQFLPGLKRFDKSDIVLMGSEAGISGGRRGAIYSASKAALRGFAQALRDESAKAGVRVSIINPGMVKTPFFDQLAFSPGEDSDNFIEPDDVAQAVMMILRTRAGTVFDEINLSPLKKVIQFTKNQGL